VARATALTVKTPADYEAAVEFRKELKTARKDADDFFDPGIKAAHQAHKIACETKRKVTDHIDLADKLVDKAQDGYERDQKAKAEEEERRLNAEAQERERREREANLKRAAEAKKPETRAKYEEAAANVAPAPVVRVQPNIPKANGQVNRTLWDAEIVDRDAFLGWLFDGKRDPFREQFISINDKELRSYATRMKQGAQKIPGVRFFDKTSRALMGR